MAKLRINYLRVVSQADSMKQLSRDLGTEIDRFETMQNGIKSGWDGPASDEYCRRLSSLITEMRKTQRKMSDISDIIKRSARKIKEEDERAADLARTLR